MPLSLKKTETESRGPDPNAFYRAWQGFAGPHGIAQYDQKLRGDDPLVVNTFENFVLEGVPKSEWPTWLDRAHAMRKTRVEAIEAERVAEELRQAKANPVRLEAPRLHRLKRDVIARRDGRIAMVLKGSVVLANDELLAANPDDFDAA